MAQLKVFGSTDRLREVLFRWRDEIKPTGGDTVIAFAPGTARERLAREVYATLVTEYSFTPLDTTIPDAPEKAPKRLPDEVDPETEYTFIPQYAGG